MPAVGDQPCTPGRARTDTEEIRMTDSDDQPQTDQGATFRNDVTVKLVKHSAGDTDVLFAARVSTAGEASLDETSKDPERSTGLINYLMRDRHGTPFEHNSMTFLVSAPIFVFREFHRHRAGWSYNEESGRYRELESVFYVPGEDRPLIQQGRPGRYEFVQGTPEQHKQTVYVMENAYREAYEAYRKLLDAGTAREIARGPARRHVLLHVRDLQRALADALPVAAYEEGQRQGPLVPAARDRDGGGADGAAMGEADAPDPRRVRAAWPRRSPRAPLPTSRSLLQQYRDIPQRYRAVTH